MIFSPFIVLFSYNLNNKSMNFINSIEIEKYKDLIIDFLITFWWKVVLAIFVLWIWFKIINVLNNTLLKFMEKVNWDLMLESFLVSIISISLKILLFIIVAWIMWVETTAFIAILTAAWFAIWMALSGTLQNFAGWIIIIMLKPFKIGDYINSTWVEWEVKQIWIFSTRLMTPNKQRVIVPNSKLSNETMTNYSSEKTRRIDLEIWISYSDSIKKAKDVLEEIAKDEKNIIQEEWITIWVKSLWDSAIILVFRAFTKSENYWETLFRLNENIKETFDKEGLNFPFPQRDVHMYKEN